MSPLVSIVIPAFNAMGHLPETLQSAQSQSHANTEILIVNDGSTDGVVEFVARQQDPRIKLLSQPNRGLAAARNTGIAAAKGAYIAFLDADDLWDAEKLACQVGALESSASAGLAHTGIRYIDRCGRPLNKPLAAFGNGSVRDSILLENPVRCGSTPVVRASCFADVGTFDESLRFSEDWDMWIRIARRYDFIAIGRPLTSYRQHEANMTKSHTVIMPNMLKILDKAFRERDGSAENLKRKAYGRAYLFAAWRAHLEDDFKLAGSHQIKAVRHSPRLFLSRTNISLMLHEISACLPAKRKLRSRRSAPG